MKTQKIIFTFDELGLEKCHPIEVTCDTKNGKRILSQDFKEDDLLIVEFECNDPIETDQESLNFIKNIQFFANEIKIKVDKMEGLLVNFGQNIWRGQIATYFIQLEVTQSNDLLLLQIKSMDEKYAAIKQFTYIEVKTGSQLTGNMIVPFEGVIYPGYLSNVTI